MFSKEAKQEALDFWFALEGTISPEAFVEELGYPLARTLRGWIRNDPRYNPDKPTYKSLTPDECAQVCSDYAAGLGSMKKLAEKYHTSASTILNILKRKNSVSPRKKAVLSGKNKTGVKPVANKPPKPEKKKKDPPEIQFPSVEELNEMDPQDRVKLLESLGLFERRDVSKMGDDVDALKAYIQDMELNNAILKELTGIPKASLRRCSKGGLASKVKAYVISRLRKTYKLKVLLKKFRLSKSTFYAALKSLNKPDIDEELIPLVEEIFTEEGNSSRGYRFVRARLTERLGHTISEKVVRRIMKKAGLVLVYKKKKKNYSSYEGEIGGAPANLLRDPRTGKHHFYAPRPGQLLVTDVTMFNIGDKKPRIYLSVIMDLFDHKILGYSISYHPTAEFANSSLKMALKSLGEDATPIIHSDRGCHYRWDGWKEICRQHGVIRSMSRKGASPDNAAMEGFFGVFKNEHFYGRDWKDTSAEEFVTLLEGWIKDWSSKRLREFRVDGKRIFDTIDNRRRDLGYAA